MSDDSTPEKIDVAIAQIAFLEVQQSVGLSGFTDEVVRAAKNKAAELVRGYIGYSVANTYAAPGDYKQFLRVELMLAPARRLREAVEETQVARKQQDEIMVFKKNKLKIPENKEYSATQTLHRARMHFGWYFHRSPIVPWTLEQLETMCETKEFIENAPVKAVKKSKKGSRVRSSIDV